jgi:hypothetical protein
MLAYGVIAMLNTIRGLSIRVPILHGNWLIFSGSIYTFYFFRRLENKKHEVFYILANVVYAVRFLAQDESYQIKYR